MNAKMETMNSAAGKTLGSMEQLTGLERALLVIPLLVGFVLGILALLWGAQLAALTGGTGKDVYLYRLTGAVLLGYVPGLLLTILNGVWTPARIVVIATLVFGLGLLYAVAVALLSSVAEPIVWLIAVTAALTVAITLWLLNQRFWQFSRVTRFCCCWWCSLSRSSRRLVLQSHSIVRANKARVRQA